MVRSSELEDMQSIMEQTRESIDSQTAVYASLLNYLTYSPDIEEIIKEKNIDNYTAYEKYTEIADPLLSVPKSYHDAINRIQLFADSIQVEHEYTLVPLDKMKEEWWSEGLKDDVRIQWKVDRTRGEVVAVRMTYAHQKLNAVLCISLDYDKIFQPLTNILTDENGGIVADKDGNVLYNKTGLTELKLSDDNKKDTSQTADKLLSKISQTCTWTQTESEENDWVFYFYKSQDAISGSVRRLLLEEIPLIIACGFIILFLGLSFSRIFTRKIEELTKNQESLKQEKLELEKYKNEKTITKDGHQVELLANIGGPQDIQIVIDNTAEGVGLLRSEFLYMDAIDFPSEDEQFIAYKKIAESLENKRLVIRTLDIGGDKDLKYMKLPKEENPFLGYRAIRIYLDNVDLFKVQLRAILRASSYGNVAIMLPMISSIEELRKSKEIIEEVKQELKTKNIKFNENIEVGIMVEIPASAVMADKFAKECDFFSIGTNDLIQYTIAVERGNEKLVNLYSHFNPAVIHLIKSAIDGAHKNGILCGMCGEAAGDVNFIPLLVGLGLDEFSMNANKILKARKLIIDLNFKECKELANKVLKLESTEEVKRILDNFRDCKL